MRLKKIGAIHAPPPMPPGSLTATFCLSFLFSPGATPFCSKCKQKLPNDQFSENQKKKNQSTRKCKGCVEEEEGAKGKGKGGGKSVPPTPPQRRSERHKTTEDVSMDVDSDTAEASEKVTNET